jgi:hypothetical protein
LALKGNSKPDIYKKNNESPENINKPTTKIKCFD